MRTAGSFLPLLSMAAEPLALRRFFRRVAALDERIRADGKLGTLGFVDSEPHDAATRTNGELFAGGRLLHLAPLHRKP